MKHLILKQWIYFPRSYLVGMIFQWIKSMIYSRNTIMMIPIMMNFLCALLRKSKARRILRFNNWIFIPRLGLFKWWNYVCPYKIRSPYIAKEHWKYVLWWKWSLPNICLWYLRVYESQRSWRCFGIAFWKSRRWLYKIISNFFPMWFVIPLCHRTRCSVTSW